MTEENNMSSEEQEIEETPTEEKSPVEEEVQEEPTVPLHQLTAQRARAQVAEVAAARAEGALEAIKSQQQTSEPTVKSPTEIAMEAEGVDDPDDLERPFAVFQAQQVFDKQQAADATAASTRQARSEAQLSSRELAIVAHPDWQSVVNDAIKHMTKGEMLDLESEGENFGEKIYAKSQQVLERIKPVTKAAPETELSKSEAEAKVKADAEAKAKADAEKVPSQDEVLNKSDNPRISHVMSL